MVDLAGRLREFETWIPFPPGDYECVAVTKRKKGGLNAGAVGVSWDGSFFRLRLFEGSNTFAAVDDISNDISPGGVFSLCFFSPAKRFFIIRAGLVGWGDDVEEFPLETYDRAPCVGGEVYFIAESDFALGVAPVEKRVVNHRDSIGETRVLLCRAEPVWVLKKPEKPPGDTFMPLTVGGDPVVSLAVRATRARALFSYGRADDARRLAGEIKKEVSSIAEKGLVEEKEVALFFSFLDGVLGEQ